MNKTLHSLEIDDYLMDEDGDIYRIVNIEFRTAPNRRDYRDITIDCLTSPDDSLMWSFANADISLNEEWVWHSRFGSLL